MAIVNLTPMIVTFQMEPLFLGEWPQRRGRLITKVASVITLDDAMKMDKLPEISEERNVKKQKGKVQKNGEGKFKKNQRGKFKKNKRGKVKKNKRGNVKKESTRECPKIATRA